MKKLCIATLLLFLAGAYGFGRGSSEEPYVHDPSMTIRELSAAQHVPIKSLSAYLDAESSLVVDTSLRTLGITGPDVIKALEGYRAGESRFIWSIVGTGMLIVFTSLLLVSLLIGLFRHLHIFDRSARRGENSERTSVGSVVGTITSSGDLSERSIAAVVAAVFLHEEEVEAETRLLTTWQRRASINLRRTHDALPNEAYYSARRGRT